MRKFFIISLCFCLLLFLNGCYYSQSDVNKMKDEADNAYLSLQSKNEDLLSDLEKYKSFYDNAFEPYFYGSFRSYDDAGGYLLDYFEEGEGTKDKALEAAEYLYYYIYHIYR